MLSKAQKDRLADYIFGFHSADFRTFERDVIEWLLYPLTSAGRLRFHRVVLYSFFVGIIMMVLTFGALNMMHVPDPDAITEPVAQRPYDPYIAHKVTAVLIILGAPPAIFSAAYDFWSLRITQELFIRRDLSLRGRLFAYPLDIILSVMPVAIGVILSNYLMQHVPMVTETSGLGSLTPSDWLILVFTMASLLSVLSVLFVSLMQAIIITVGLALRALSKLTQLNQKIALNSAAYENPLKFVGIIVGLLIAGVQAAI